MKKLLVFLVVFFYCSMINPSLYAQEVSHFIYACPYWKGFTNKDGTGLYHEALQLVFGLENVTVEHKVSKLKIGADLVRAGEADAVTCVPDDQSQYHGLIMPRFQMFEDDFHVIFKKNLIQDWQGQKSMENQRVVSRIGYYSDKYFDVPVRKKEVKTGVSALAMVILERADFYVDHISLINNSIDQNKMVFDKNDFRIEAIGKRKYLPVFKQSPRGEAMMKVFESGMEKAIRSGELKKLYDKYGFPFPTYNIQ